MWFLGFDSVTTVARKDQEETPFNSVFVEERLTLRLKVSKNDLAALVDVNPFYGFSGMEPQTRLIAHLVHGARSR